jgi:hypothetical protein
MRNQPSGGSIMSTLGRLGLCLAALSAGAALMAPAAMAAIKCEKGSQRVQGKLMATPYCQDAYLAQVAREYGFKVSAARLRNDPNYKKEICQFVFNDIRVQGTCLSAGVPEFFGGGF